MGYLRRFPPDGYNFYVKFANMETDNLKYETKIRGILDET